MRMPQPATGPGASGDSAADSTGGSGAAVGDVPLAADPPPVTSPASHNGSANHVSADHAPADSAAVDSAAVDSAATNGARAADTLADHAPADSAAANGARADRSLANGAWTGRTAGGQQPRRRVAVLAAVGLGMVRRHWLASALLTAGLVLRVLVQMAYHPAIIYIDSLKYLYDAWPGSDPVAYKIPLKMILAVGDLGTVTLIQHLLGLAIAVTIYVVMMRRGAPRWLGALAIAPVLFDGYQLQAEHMIMPDVWFEAMIVAGLAVLLWNPKPNLLMLIIGSALLGGSTGMRQAGEILIVPALIFAVALGGGWRKIAVNAASVAVAFILAVGLYMSAAAELTGHFRISESSSSLTYGRMAAVANCATLRLGLYEKPLCPTPAQQALGPDWLDHDTHSPLKAYRTNYELEGAPDGSFNKLVSHFNRAVEFHQPTLVISGILHDGVKLFAVTRVTSRGDTPIWRWRFQTSYQTFAPYVFIKNNSIMLSLPQGLSVLGLPQAPKVEMLNPAYGGAPEVDKPIAAFLRGYQLHGGYTPGPLLLLFTLTGLAGSLLIFARRRLTPVRQQLVMACLLFFSTAAAVLAISDAFEFTWRYQLPALVTLPPAGALGIGVLIAFARRSRRPASADTVSERAPELAAPAK